MTNEALTSKVLRNSGGSCFEIGSNKTYDTTLPVSFVNIGSAQHRRVSTPTVRHPTPLSFGSPAG